MITTITVSYSKKINLGDYESAEASISVTAEPDDEGMGVKEATKVLQDFCRNQVHLALETDKEGANSFYSKQHFRYGNKIAEETRVTEDFPF